MVWCQLDGGNSHWTTWSLESLDPCLQHGQCWLRVSLVRAGPHCRLSRLSQKNRLQSEVTVNALSSPPDLLQSWPESQDGYFKVVSILMVWKPAVQEAVTFLAGKPELQIKQHSSATGRAFKPCPSWSSRTRSELGHLAAVGPITTQSWHCMLLSLQAVSRLKVETPACCNAILSASV